MSNTVASEALDSLAARFSNEVAQSRNDLQQLSRLHPDFVREGLAAIDAVKVKRRGPGMGELFPHVLAQGLKLDDHDRRLLAAAWLALYGYTRLVDDALDKTGSLNGRITIAASGLLGWGIATLGRYAAGTPYEKVFVDNINRAFAGQYLDIVDRTCGNASREQIDFDKNRAFVAAGAGFSAAARESDERLVRALEQVIAAWQTLDDLEDVEEDCDENNPTVFVRIIRECSLSAAQLTRSEMYRVLIKDPRVKSLLIRAGEALDQSLLILDSARD